MKQKKNKLNKIGISTALAISIVASGIDEKIVNANENTDVTDNKEEVSNIDNTTLLKTVKEAKEDVTLTTNEKDKAQKEVENIENELADKQKQLASIEKSILETESSVEDKNESITNLIESTKNEAKSNYDNSIKQLDAINEEITKLEDELDNAKKELKIAEENYQKISEQNPNMETEIEEKQANLVSANSELENATKDLEEKTITFDNLTNDKNKKEETVSNLETLKQTQEGLVNTASEDVTSKQEAYNNAKAKKEEAENKLNSDVSYQEANAKKTEAESKLNELNSAKETKEQALRELETQKETATSEYEAKKTIFSAKEQELTQENANLTDLKNVQKPAKEQTYNTKIQEKETAQNELNLAREEDVAQQRKLDEAKTLLQTAQNNVAEKERLLADARTSAETHKLNWENSKAEATSQIAKGSLGFFEQMNSTNAIETLKNGYRMINNTPFVVAQTGQKITSYTEIGDPNDATSLENMKKAIELMKIGNQYRVAGDNNFPSRSALKVSDDVMAVAQLNANYSRDYTKGHSGYFGKPLHSFGENLAWSDDAYDGWYTAEKVLYDRVGSVTYVPDDKAIIHGSWHVNTTGHYTNLMNSNYGVSGFGYRTNQKVTAQVFWGDASDATYTVDEYETRFNGYYNPLKEKAENGDSSLKSIYDNSVNNISTKERELEEARTQLQTAQTKLSKEEAKKTETEQKITQAESKLQTATTSEEKAKNDLDLIKEQIQTKETEIQQKQEAVNTYRQQLEDAKRTVDEKTRLITETSAEIGSLNQQILEATTKVDEAKNQLTNVENKLQSLKEEVEGARSLENSTKGDLERATEDKTTKENKLQELITSLDTARTELETIKNNLDTAETNKNQAQTVVNGKNELVKNANTELAETKNKYKNLTDSKEIVDDTKLKVSEVESKIIAETVKKTEKENEVQENETKLNQANRIDKDVESSYADFENVKSEISNLNKINQDLAELNTQKNNIKNNITELENKLEVAKNNLKTAEQNQLNAIKYLNDNFGAKVVFDPSGGRWQNGSTAPIVLEGYIEDELKVLEAPTRAGYRFVYWKGSVYYPGDKYNIKDKNHTLVAIWEKIEVPEQRNVIVNGQQVNSDINSNDTKDINESTLQSNSKEKLPKTGVQTTKENIVFALLISAMALYIRKKKMY